MKVVFEDCKAAKSEFFSLSMLSISVSESFLTNISARIWLQACILIPPGTAMIIHSNIAKNKHVTSILLSGLFNRKLVGP